MKRAASSLAAHYRSLWLAFVDAADAQNLGAEASPSTGVDVSLGSDSITLSSMLLLRDWPFKAVSKKRLLDIAVKISEVIADDLVMKATTQVAW